MNSKPTALMHSLDAQRAASSPLPRRSPFHLAWLSMLAVTMLPSPLLAQPQGRSDLPEVGRSPIGGNAGGAGGDANHDLAVAATGILKSHCYQCHGATFNGSAIFNVMDPVGLLENDYIDPTDVESSEMWGRIIDDDMPPSDSGVPPLSAEEKQIVADWIAAGAPQVLRQQRPFIHADQIITSVYEDLSRSERDSRPYYRYFSLTHLHNDYVNVTDLNLRLYRAAFSKAINSLSYEPRIYVPQLIDAEQTVFRIDLRELGWTTDQWKWLVGRYPYGLHYENSPDERLADLDEQIDTLSGSKLCVMRADWFINHATRPEIYHRFLQIPETVSQLEQTLRVDPIRNYEQNRIARAGFATSGVSNGNRLVERHAGVHGVYWKSYDFKKSGAANNLFRFPLGPSYPGHQYPKLAFEHDGGEMIFTLPNGLQAYMLCDEKGNRIDIGPIEVVRDTKEISGTPQVVNGISCMHCHQHGMIDFADTVRAGAGVFDQALRKVRNIYPERTAMDRLIAQDRASFLTALDQTIGPFLRVGADASKPIESFPEPVGAIARLYQRDLDLRVVACELSIEDPAELAVLIRGNRSLQQIGLAPLAGEATIKRDDWESTRSFVSPFQETARQIGRGTPIN